MIANIIKQNKEELIIVALFIVGLSLITGINGLIISLILSITTIPLYLALKNTSLDSDLSFPISVLIMIGFVPTVSYYIGILTNLVAGFIVTLLLITVTAGIIINRDHRSKKENKHGQE